MVAIRSLVVMQQEIVIYSVFNHVLSKRLLCTFHLIRYVTKLSNSP
ncbi:Hypothetical predicted protein [Paramuricea clavata]|uniref:Uncharacterized protein n=1 Tax=Paramuricea clavata TaxID=317549 RepID=A0A7D9EMJ1_PARCT|nr:Hypothetical predicted protein [Paramuricea clavata]